jgi:hypothetical protein
MLQELALNLKNIALVPVQTYPHSKFNISLLEPHGKTHKKPYASLQYIRESM